MHEPLPSPPHSLFPSPPHPPHLAGSVFFVPAGVELSLVAQGAEELVIWVAATNTLLHQLHAAVGAGAATQQPAAAIA